MLRSGALDEAVPRQKILKDWVLEEPKVELRVVPRAVVMASDTGFQTVWEMALEYSAGEPVVKELGTEIDQEKVLE